MEVYNERDMKTAGIDRVFVQENQSCSKKGVLRGLHFQKEYPQCKLARVLRGAAYDVAVDVRKGSATYGQWYGVELSAKNRKMFLIPEGFAHGLLALTENTVFCYKCTDFYHPGDEGGIAWNDPTIGVAWPVRGAYPGNGSAKGYTLMDGTPLKVSEKDQQWKGLHEDFEMQAL